MSQLNGHLNNLDALVGRTGLSDVDLEEVIKPGALVEALRVVL